MRFVLAGIICLWAVAGWSQCGPGQSLVTININPDNNPQETFWELRSVAPSFQYITGGTYHDTSFCVPADSCFLFRIYDTGMDGLCCSNGNGGYGVTVNGVLQTWGVQFTDMQWAYINCGPGGACNAALPVTVGTHSTPLQDTWYVFQPDSTGPYRITTCGMNTCDTKIWVYDYCHNLNWTNTNMGTSLYSDNACGLQSEVNGYFMAGLTYYIRIGNGTVSGQSCFPGPITWLLDFLGPVQGCMDPFACNYDGSATVDDGSCIYAPDPNCPASDLVVVESEVQNSLNLDQIAATQCMVQEGCITGYGLRDLLRFTTHIKNIGDRDFYIGPPSSGNPHFIMDPCHGHWHYVDYAAYYLYDMSGHKMPAGFKNGFCVMDLECTGGGSAIYSCSNMGISAGCGDIYISGTPCQWIDITDVDTGIYQLVVKTNWLQTPDVSGHYESDYTNNWAAVCIHLGRDAQGIPSFTLANNCPPDFTDCLGMPFGNAEYDCNGVCNGPALAGNMNADTVLSQSDALLYADGLLDHQIPVTTCRDMDADGEVTVFDATLINHCAVDGGIYPNLCEFPRGVTNHLDTAWLEIMNVNFNQKYVDVAIRNPLSKVTAYQFNLHGVEIQAVQNLVPPLEYSVNPTFGQAYGEVMGISYQEMLVDKNTSFDALCRIYYHHVTDSLICIEHISDIVSENFEAMHTEISGNCVPVPSVFSLGEWGNTVSAYIFPNPAGDMISISLGLSERSDVEMVVFDALGRPVMTQVIPDVDVKTVQVNMSSFANGVYSVMLRTATGKITRRVVLSH